MRHLVLILGFLVALSQAAVGGEVRELNRSFTLESQSSIRLDMPVAEVNVVGSSGRTVETEFTATCKRDQDCDEVLRHLDFESHGSQNTLRVDLVGYPKWGKGRLELEGVVRVPKSVDVEIELGVGELDIKGLEGDVRVELGVGEINAWIERAKTRSVTLDAGVGEVELYGTDRRVAGRRSMLVGSEVYWDEGPGKARVFLEVGVGEISVWME
ncbi:MAG: hypothetical protein OEM62_10265 [Acidobacteriota bacterium]|nr:hypothetical protein [Acidobacteriota bacterium]